MTFNARFSYLFMSSTKRFKKIDSVTDQLNPPMNLTICSNFPPDGSCIVLFYRMETAVTCTQQTKFVLKLAGSSKPGYTLLGYLLGALYWDPSFSGIIIPSGLLVWWVTLRRPSQPSAPEMEG